MFVRIPPTYEGHEREEPEDSLHELHEREEPEVAAPDMQHLVHEHVTQRFPIKPLKQAMRNEQMRTPYTRDRR